MPQRRRSSSPRINPLPTDILMVLPDLGIEVEKVSTNEAWAICPNPKHADRSPSWSINLETGGHNCFSCAWGGNFIRLVKVVKDLDDEKAEEWIRKRGGIGVARKKLLGEGAYKRKEAEAVTDADLAIYDEWIPNWALRERDVIQESCEAYGVRWDPKRNLWILPVRDPFTQELMGWQEKGDDHFLNVPKHLEKSLALFGYHLLGDTAYVEESPLDTVRLHTYGVDGAVSGYGVHISDFQMDLIVEHPKVRRVVMCLDNDDAGRRKEVEIWEKYRGRTKLYFANYETTDKKDHGDMSPEEIAYSLEHPISALRFRP